SRPSEPREPDPSPALPGRTYPLTQRRRLAPVGYAAMKTPHGIQITAVDLDDRSDADLTEAARFQQRLSQERVPEDPPTPVEAIKQRLRAKTEGQWRAIFAARDESGTLVGTGFVGWNKNEPENAHARWTEVNV